MLKSLLSLLLSKFYSKQESEAVGHQAMPSVSAISLSPITSSVTDWAPVYEGIAPTDGYAAITFTADTDNCIAAAQTTNINTFSTPQVKGDVLTAACPVAKGQPFGLYAREAHDIACWFTKTIGGGYQALKKLILQGGGLCLKTWFSSLRRSSCRVRGRGFNTQSAHHLRRFISLSLKTMRGTLLRPVRTVTLRSQETPRVSFWKFPLAARGLLIAEHLRGDTSFLSQKVSHSHTWCHLIQLLTRFSLSQCRLKTNSAVGGASC